MRFEFLEYALARNVLGRQPNGWRHRTLPTPWSMSSSISAVSSQPSPAWLPVETMPRTLRARSAIRETGRNRLPSSARRMASRRDSMRLMSSQLLKAGNAFRHVPPQIDGIEQAIEEKVHEIGQDGLAAFFHNVADDLIVGVGMVLEQDFAHDAHAGQGCVSLTDGREIPHDAPHVRLEQRAVAPRRAELHAVHPVGQPIVRIPGVALMGAGGQRDALEHVPVEAAQDEPVQQARGDGESGLVVQGTPAQGQDGHIPEPASHRALRSSAG